MNIFEKYIANVQENEQLSKKIDKLCYAYLFSENDLLIFTLLETPESDIFEMTLSIKQKVLFAS